MNKHLTAADINRYISWLGDISYRDFKDDTTYNEESYKLLAELFEVLKAIKPVKDEIYHYWISAPRGTLEEFAQYHKEEDEPITDDIVEWWHDELPNETMLYEVTAIVDNSLQFDYSAIVINNKHVVENDSSKKHKGYPYDISEFLGWILDETKKAITSLKEGSYNDMVLRLMPNHSRTGTIVRKDFWDIFPESREDFFSEISTEQIEEFCQHASKMPSSYKDFKPRMDKVTANDFYYFCSLGYKENNYDYCDLTPKEQYYKHADGRDGDLKDIDGNSVEAFDEWSNDQRHTGSHPWEVCRGGNSTHISLCVQKDDKGYYLWLDGVSIGRCIETIKFFLALHRADIPVFLDDAKTLADRLQEKDLIGIVPSGVFPRYCHGRFPGEEVYTFMNLPYEKEAEIVKKVKWQPIGKVELAEV